MALYLYAIVEGMKAPPRARGVGPGPLHLFRAGGFTLLAGAAPRLVDPGALSALERHDRVVRLAHRKAHATLPFRFGTQVETPDEAAVLLRPRRKAVRAALKLVQGRDQLTLRLLGPPALEAKRAAPAPRDSGKAYLAARAQQARKKHAVPELDGVREQVVGLIHAERSERVVGTGPLRATVFHLVDRPAVGAYLRQVKRAPGLPAQWRLFISRPGPAYAFGPEELR